MVLEQLSFSPDSPLFSKRVQDFDHDFYKLGEYIRVLSKLMQQYCKDIRKAAKSCEAFHIHMREGLEASNSNASFHKVMKKVSDVFGEIATSQEILADSLTQSFVNPIEDFYNNDIKAITTLKQSYKRDKLLYDDFLVRYLQNDTSFGLRNLNNNSQMDVRALDLVQQRKKFELNRFDMINEINSIEKRKSFVITECCVSSLIMLRSSHRECNESLNSSEKFILDMNKLHFEERTHFQHSQIEVGTHRSKIVSELQRMIDHVESQMPQPSPDETGNIFEHSVDLNRQNSIDENRINVTAVATNALNRISVFGANFLSGLTNKNQSSNAHSNEISNSINVPNKFMIKKPSAEFVIQPVGSVPPADEAIAGSGSGIHVTTPTLIEVESRMKALDKSRLEEQYILNDLEEFAGVVKQGYILEKSGVNKLLQQQWTREWLVIDDTKLYFIKERDSVTMPLEVHIVCDTMLASVRELKPDTQHANTIQPFQFEITYANLRSYILQAEGPKEYSLWLEAIRSAIEKRLISGSTSAPLQSSGSSKCASPIANKKLIAATQARRRLNQEVLSVILAANESCAECGKRDPRPDWVSLNLGVLVCIDCSGVHRSMGVHISKVRSLTLDDLEPEEYLFLSKIGNINSNIIWESRLPTGMLRPTPSDSYQSRDKFIRAKYQLKSFLELPSFDESKEDELKNTQFETFLEACSVDDVVQVVRLIAEGIDVNYVHQSVHCLDRVAGSCCPHCSLTDSCSCSNVLVSTTALHVAAEHGSLCAVVCLLMNGADIYAVATYESKYNLMNNESISENAMDERCVGLLAEEVATAAEKSEIAAYLNRKAEVMRSGNRQQDSGALRDCDSDADKEKSRAISKSDLLSRIRAADGQRQVGKIQAKVAKVLGSLSEGTKNTSISGTNKSTK